LTEVNTFVPLLIRTSPSQLQNGGFDIGTSLIMSGVDTADLRPTRIAWEAKDPRARKQMAGAANQKFLLEKLMR
jgi:hypothetical protein